MDSCHPKQDQVEGFLVRLQIQDTSDQLSFTVENQQDVAISHHFFCPLNAMKGFFASCPLSNNRLNHGMIGRYQQTFAGRQLLVLASSVNSSDYTLYRDTPHVGHCRSFAYSFLYNMQSLGHAWIFLYSIPTGHKIFLAS